MVHDHSNGIDKIETLSWQFQPGSSFSGFPWGPHKLPLRLALDDASIALEKSGDGYLYRRENKSGTVEKAVLAGKGGFYLCPVEPFHNPPGVSEHLLIKFDHPVLLEPRSSSKIYLTFPLEIAAVFEHRQFGEAVLDLFSFVQPKLSLYGSVKSGLVCRYWQSRIEHAVPRLNPLAEGILQLEINNSGNRWAEINQAVFSALAMKIYYNAQLVAMQATMKISSELTAETAFNDKPLERGMRKAPEQFSARLLSLPGRMVMEEGY